MAVTTFSKLSFSIVSLVLCLVRIIFVIFITFNRLQISMIPKVSAININSSLSKMGISIALVMVSINRKKKYKPKKTFWSQNCSVSCLEPGF